MTLYSTAPKCQHCGMKAMLDEMAAWALVDAAASGKLEAYPCPVGNDWHVRNPESKREH